MSDSTAQNQSNDREIAEYEGELKLLMIVSNAVHGKSGPVKEMMQIHNYAWARSNPYGQYSTVKEQIWHEVFKGFETEIKRVLAPDLHAQLTKSNDSLIVLGKSMAFTNYLAKKTKEFGIPLLITFMVIGFLYGIFTFRSLGGLLITMLKSAFWAFFIGVVFMKSTALCSTIAVAFKKIGDLTKIRLFNNVGHWFFNRGFKVDALVANPTKAAILFLTQEVDSQFEEQWKKLSSVPQLQGDTRRQVLENLRQLNEFIHLSLSNVDWFVGRADFKDAEVTKVYEWFGPAKFLFLNRFIITEALTYLVDEKISDGVKKELHDIIHAAHAGQADFDAKRQLKVIKHW